MTVPFFLSQKRAERIANRYGVPVIATLNVDNSDDEGPSHSFRYEHVSSDVNLIDSALLVGYPNIGEGPADFAVAVTRTEEDRLSVFANFRILFGTLVNRKIFQSPHEENKLKSQGIPFDKIWACQVIGKNFWGQREVYPLAPWDIVVCVTPSHAYAVDNYTWETEPFTPDPNEGKIIYARGAKLLAPEDTILTRDRHIHQPRIPRNGESACRL